MAITSVNDLWGKKWVVAENPTEMTGDSYDVNLKLNAVPSPIMHVMNYHYNYCNHVDFYSHETTGVVLRFMRNSTYISAYTQIPDYPENTNMHTIRKGSRWEGAEGVTPRLIEFINQPSGYSFEENSHIVAWWNTNCTEVDGVTFDAPQEYAKIFEDIATSIKNKTGKNYLLTPSLMSAEIETISGSEASGTITITTNGTHDVAAYATAEVNVAGGGGITPEGTLNITVNGDYNVTNYATASVNVPIPEGYIIPEGTIEITENTTTDVTNYATVVTNVPNVIPEGYIIPEGTLNITANGDYDAAEYASVSVAVEGGGSSGPSLADYATAKGTNLSNLFSHMQEENLDEYINAINWNGVKNVSGLFYECNKLASLPTVDMSTFTNMESMFKSCHELATPLILYVPKCSSLDYTFENCLSLTEIRLDTGGGVNNMFGTFRNCPRVRTIDLDDFSYDKSYEFYIFEGCRSLTKLIIRKMPYQAKISSGIFKDCYHFDGTVSSTYNPDGLKDGRIYVPDEMVDTLKAATNWSVYADIIVPLSTLEE